MATPLTMGCCLLFATLFIALVQVTFLNFIWLSYTLVLIILGGLLVIFIYLTLLSPDEQWHWPKNLWVAFLPLPLRFKFSFAFYGSGEAEIHRLATESNEWLVSVYSTELSFFFSFIALYLLLTLIIIVCNVKSFNITLRSSYVNSSLDAPSFKDC